MKRLLLALFPLLSVACEGAAWTREEVKAPIVAPTDARWSQYCTFYGASDLARINAFLEHQGEAGWELVSVTGKTGTVYCFKTKL